MAEVATPSFLDALDEQPAPRAEIAVPDLTPRKLRARGQDLQAERLKSLEDTILEDSMNIVRGGLKGAYVDDGEKDIPNDWIAQHGLVAAGHMLRMAQDARRSPKFHPVYLDLAKSVMVGIIKARAQQKAAPTSLNVSITLAAPKAAYAIIDLEPDPEK